MGSTRSEYGRLFRDRGYVRSLILGILVLLAAAPASALAIGYADSREAHPLGDLILDNIPTIHLYGFRASYPFLMIPMALIIGLKDPKYLPLATKSVGLMYNVRAFFISLTNLGCHPDRMPISARYELFTIFPLQGNDLFFSGHVAFPVMVALVFWEKRNVRTFFVFSAVVSGVAALLAKTHYSIDVFAAPLMSYAIFKISEKIFPNDVAYIRS